MIQNYVEEYINKLTFADEAVKQIKSGDRVIYAFGVCSVNELDLALSLRKDELRDVVIICNDIHSCSYFSLEADTSGTHFRVYERIGTEGGNRYDRMYAGGESCPTGVCPKKRKGKQPRYIFMATVSPMDKDGYFWCGTHPGLKVILKEYLEMAECVILEINERIIEDQETDQGKIHISQVDSIVCSRNSSLIKNTPGAGLIYSGRKQSSILAASAV